MDLIQANHEIVLRAVKYLIKKLDLTITDIALERDLELNPQHPSLISIIEALNMWNIHNMFIAIPYEKLTEIPLPAIAEMRNADDNDEALSIAILTKVSNQKIKLFDSEKAIEKWVEIDDFLTKWTGNIIIVEIDDHSGESNFEKNNEKIFVKKSRDYMAYIAGLSMFILVLLFNRNYEFFVLLVWGAKLIGALFCLFLIIKGLNMESKAIENFCKIGGKRSDCSIVINSQVSKLFGWLKLSEIGFIYFIGGLITLSFAYTLSFRIYSILGIFAFLNLLTLPFSLYLVLYQAIKIKIWCPLCLGVQLVLWMELVLFVFALNSLRVFSIDTQSICFTAFNFLLVNAIFFLITDLSQAKGFDKS